METLCIKTLSGVALAEYANTEKNWKKAKEQAWSLSRKTQGLYQVWLIDASDKTHTLLLTAHRLCT